MLGHTDYVFLLLTWHRLGVHPDRLRRYASFPCQARRRRHAGPTLYTQLLGCWAGCTDLAWVQPKQVHWLLQPPPCPPLQVILCANTPDEHAELAHAGMRCLLFNQNAALDERLFDITAPAAGKPGGLAAY